jgi:NAD(P)-dependent dehydrogenase (short-subunit alcohol dehydrogenase family)
MTMAKIFITGSADGLGSMAARLLIEQGHEVTLHARNADRAHAASRSAPGARGVVIGDVQTLAGMRDVASQANASGRFDAVIHNVAIGYREPRRVATADGFERLFAINVLAPYVLTALMTRPSRLVYLSSGMHHGGDSDLSDVNWERRRWNGSDAYSTSKLLDTVLAFAIARRWPDVLSNSVEPGWVATKMGGAGAPDDLEAAPITQAWLATSTQPAAMVSGHHFYHQRERRVDPRAHDVALQDELVARCAQLTHVNLPT